MRKNQGKQIQTFQMISLQIEIKDLIQKMKESQEEKLIMNLDLHFQKPKR